MSSPIRPPCVPCVPAVHPPLNLGGKEGDSIPLRDLVDQVENKVGGTTVSKYDYTNDTIGRRTGVQKSGTAFTATDTIAWGYDNRSQVTSAVAATDATYDYTYAYDPIGNRTSSVTKETGTPVTTGYTSSQLNQYTAITSRTDPTYDDDGNMTLLPAAAGDWTLAWDGENRLASAESATKRLEFVYDHMDRRIERRTYDGAPGDWTLAETRRFLYDGWHLVAEFDHQSGVNTLKCTHLWGLDLSQSVGGAGGVGGLLRTTLYPTSPIGGGWAQGQRYYPTYDGNGNVSEYLDAAAAIAARHQYSPFGRLTVSTGLALPFRFSTKYLDADTSLYYYGYRHYSPELGRWLSRDPIGERGGRNLSAMVGNSPVCYCDLLGLGEVAIPTPEAMMAAEFGARAYRTGMHNPEPEMYNGLFVFDGQTVTPQQMGTGSYGGPGGTNVVATVLIDWPDAAWRWFWMLDEEKPKLPAPIKCCNPEGKLWDTIEVETGKAKWAGVLFEAVMEPETPTAPGEPGPQLPPKLKQVGWRKLGEPCPCELTIVEVKQCLDRLGTGRWCHHSMKATVRKPEGCYCGEIRIVESR